MKRILNINLPKKQSAFLWGPRKVGKTTYLRKRFSKSIYIDLLKTDIFLQYTKNPELLREQLVTEDKDSLTRPIILDEVQKVPQLLNEVHWLIENKDMSFILCGSSARKLKRGHVNLLGGRAWKYHMFPLVYPEIPKMNLLTALNRGTIPSHYLEKQYQRSLKGYIEDYLKEEVFSEGLTRNIPAFSRFFDSIGYSHGEMINFSNIASDCGIDSKTVRGYYQILVDTLLGKFVEPFKKRQSRGIIKKKPKFYLFDVGVAGRITRRKLTEDRGIEFGKAFEHFIFTEIDAYCSYSEADFRINYWRTKSGLEVDFILGEGEVAIEVKGSNNIKRTQLNPLRKFSAEYNPRRSIVISNEKVPRKIFNSIDILPWRHFLERLWTGEIIH